MADNEEKVVVLEVKEEIKIVAGEDSSSDDGPLESESSDPDIDSSDAICTWAGLLQDERLF